MLNTNATTPTAQTQTQDYTTTAQGSPIATTQDYAVGGRTFVQVPVQPYVSAQGHQSSQRNDAYTGTTEGISSTRVITMPTAGSTLNQGRGRNVPSESMQTDQTDAGYNNQHAYGSQRPAEHYQDPASRPHYTPSGSNMRVIEEESLHQRYDRPHGQQYASGNQYSPALQGRFQEPTDSRHQHTSNYHTRGQTAQNQQHGYQDFTRSSPYTQQHSDCPSLRPQGSTMRHQVPYTHGTHERTGFPSASNVPMAESLHPMAASAGYGGPLFAPPFEQNPHPAYAQSQRFSQVIGNPGLQRPLYPNRFERLPYPAEYNSIARAPYPVHNPCAMNPRRPGNLFSVSNNTVNSVDINTATQTRDSNNQISLFDAMHDLDNARIRDWNLETVIKDYISQFCSVLSEDLPKSSEGFVDSVTRVMNIAVRFLPLGENKVSAKECTQVEKIEQDNYGRRAVAIQELAFMIKNERKEYLSFPKKYVEELQNSTKEDLMGILQSMATFPFVDYDDRELMTGALNRLNTGSRCNIKNDRCNNLVLRYGLIRDPSFIAFAQHVEYYMKALAKEVTIPSPLSLNLLNTLLGRHLCEILTDHIRAAACRTLEPGHIELLKMYLMRNIQYVAQVVSNKVEGSSETAFKFDSQHQKTIDLGYIPAFENPATNTMQSALADYQTAFHEYLLLMTIESIESQFGVVPRDYAQQAWQDQRKLIDFAQFVHGILSEYAGSRSFCDYMIKIAALKTFLSEHHTKHILKTIEHGTKLQAKKQKQERQEKKVTIDESILLGYTTVDTQQNDNVKAVTESSRAVIEKLFKAVEAVHQKTGEESCKVPLQLYMQTQERIGLLYWFFFFPDTNLFEIFPGFKLGSSEVPKEIQDKYGFQTHDQHNTVKKKKTFYP